MSVLLGVCAVITTIALVAIAIAATRAMKKFGNASDELARTASLVRSSISEVQALARKAEDAIETVVPPLKRTAEQFQSVGDRTARLSNAVLNEIETPIRNTMAVLTGVRAGTRSLMSRLYRRNGPTYSNGGYDNE